MANRFWVGGDGTWDGSTTTHWSTTSGGSGGAAVPTSADAVIINGSSGSFSAGITIAASYTAQCASIDWSASGLASINNGGSAGLQVYGNINGNGAVTVLVTVEISGNCTFNSTDGYTVPFSIDSLVTFTLASTAALKIPSLSDVTLVLNGNTLTMFDNVSVSLGSATLTLGTGTLIVSNGTLTADSFTAISAASGTIILSGAGALNISAMGSPPTIGTLQLNGGTFTGPATITALYGGSAPAQTNIGGNFTLGGNNSIGTFDVETTGLGTGITMTLTASSTQTITTASGLTLIGTAADGNLTIHSSSSGTQANFSMASGTVNGTYLSLKDNNAEGGANFYYDAHSTIVSDVTGWNPAPTVAPNLQNQTLLSM
jgi:hypothetical protein